MDVIKNADGDKLTIAVKGRLDTTTAPVLERELKTCLNGISELIFDLSDLEYVSSAGLRVFLSAHKVMEKQGKMTVKNSKPDIMDIFEVTGFVDIFNIE